MSENSGPFPCLMRIKTVSSQIRHTPPGNPTDMEQYTHPHIPPHSSAMTLILQGAAQLEEENRQLKASEAAHREHEATLEEELRRLRRELEKEREEKAYYKGLLEGEERVMARQHVENNFFNDRTTQIRDSRLPRANIQMQVLRREE